MSPWQQRVVARYQADRHDKSSAVRRQDAKVADEWPSELLDGLRSPRDRARGSGATSRLCLGAHRSRLASI